MEWHYQSEVTGVVSRLASARFTSRSLPPRRVVVSDPCGRIGFVSSSRRVVSLPRSLSYMVAGANRVQDFGNSWLRVDWGVGGDYGMRRCWGAGEVPCTAVLEGCIHNTCGLICDGGGWEHMLPLLWSSFLVMWEVK
jgi:hypothetical protein